jgi:hypothetical protein
MDRSNVKTLNEGVVKEKYQVKITSKFAPLKMLRGQKGDRNRVGNTRKKMKISAKESLGYFQSKHHTPWFDEECSKLVDFLDLSNSGVEDGSIMAQYIRRS